MFRNFLAVFSVYLNIWGHDTAFFVSKFLKPYHAQQNTTYQYKTIKYQIFLIKSGRPWANPFRAVR